MKFLIVDAFADQTFGGNPAGVIILPSGADFPTDKVMTQTAAELRYSETAFIKQISEDEFNIRYFTPACEVDLCGHATIASFAALLNQNIIKDNHIYTNHTKAETIKVEVANGSIMMDMATPIEIHTIDEPAKLKELYSVMGAKFEKQYALDSSGKKIELLPKLISTGLPDILMPVVSQEELNNLKPDMDALSKLSELYEVTGVHAFTLETSGDETFNCRNFAPLYDIDEESATGTSNGAMTYYLYLYNILVSQDKCKVIQGEAMNRPSVIMTSLNANEEGCKIKVGGNAVILAQGEIYI